MQLKYDKMKQQYFYVFLFMYGISFGQQILTLDECQRLISINYPLAKKSQTLLLQHELEKEIISDKKLPQFSLDGQFTYQSEVINLPIPGSISLNKDQYKATLSMNQLIFNGGLIDANKKLITTQLKMKKKQLEVDMYQLKKQVNQIYFSILLAQEAALLIKTKNKLLNSKLKEVISGIKNGVLVGASGKILKVELLKNNQDLQGILNNKQKLIATLSKLINLSIKSTTEFIYPEIQITLNNKIARPELDLFQFKNEEIEKNMQVVSKKNAPTIISFVNGGFGNPGLNMLDNSFQTFYMVGAKLKWTIFDWNSTKKQQKLLALNKEIIKNNREVFLLNTEITLHQQEKEIEKIKAFVVTDKEIINLRNEVLASADSQFKNGTITASEYIAKLTDLFVDKNTLITHQIQLQLAKANYKITKGQ